MSLKSKRKLGDLDALKDSNFEDHFIEVHNLHSIIDDDSDVIYGLKGSGKTALCLALTKLNKEKFLQTNLINLDSISFSQIHNALEKLSKTTNKEIVKLASHTWHNVMLSYAIETYAQALPDDNQLKERINNFIQKKRYNNHESNSRLITFIHNLIIRIESLGYETIEDASPLGLTGRQFDEIDKIFEDELHAIILICNQLFDSDSKKVLLCFDGFDSILEHSEGSREAIFSGLVDAIYKCSKDVIISRMFCFKAFLPRELTEGVRIAHFDADKFVHNTHYLNWTKDEFEQLILKRLAIYSKTKSNNFKDIWNEHFPENVYNSVHSISENTLSYILRHTMYRPRHLLIHLQNIFESWDAKFSRQKVDPSFIPNIVSKTNSRLSELISAELEYAIPGVTQFLHSYNSISCTVTFAQFCDRMKKMFNINDRIEEILLFDKLYNIGLFGFSKFSELEKKNVGSLGCKFAYTNGGSRRMIFTSLDENDIIALSPIFQEYCGCNYSNYGYVYQR